MDESELDTHNFFEAVWDQYFITQDPLDLARYLEFGGEIDATVRSAIIRVLKEGPPKKRGGQKLYRDVEVYLGIKNIRIQPFIDAIENSTNPKNSTPSQNAKTKKRPPAPKLMKLSVAINNYKKRISYKIEDEALKKQYYRGEKYLYKK